MMEIVRQHDRKSVKVYSWVSSSAIGLHFHWGPSSRNKDGDAHLVAQREAERSGKPIQEVAEEVRVFSTVTVMLLRIVRSSFVPRKAT